MERRELTPLQVPAFQQSRKSLPFNKTGEPSGESRFNSLMRSPTSSLACLRKATLASLLARAAPGLHFNGHLDHEDGSLVFAHQLGLEGIV
jgi:hypothetical protein